MLTKIINGSNELYGVYYLVYGSLAGGDELIKAYLWAGPYPKLQTAVKKAEELKKTHQGDESFIVKKYRD
ncbi:MAG TPA: hypothetical protein DEG17_14795 [Cyanobacteria bacterium UBA11149]|nr:hypothetical protein [Cyanobacteria bacterium UBA11367]HBE57766.1 hypothetical protein [Cyanobacteria bacterium UBA11366]HBK62980.1 hypothetical protein [Cyanobacteria bacterium UBA11166]HBR77263.1 hypothetical protein [Cyanobacteria bacterium UBA11159]HBS69375.1 hypothetical protein [Cyanobacteria bacterium UBA11153]HBW90104.1 hypothetical protein [Cyanobacteria bacterium UBA11149]HCA94974.1 hypothetical protein [Cyanobacteria bacterium UBA9226]